MPQDVPLGAGYIGDALFTRFPGQYRDAEREAAGSSFNGIAQFPGNASGRPNYVDPDSGRQMVLTSMPGVGQVVVPVEHAMASVLPVQHSMASVYPSDHTMVGLDDDPSTQHGHMKWHTMLVRALDASATMKDSKAQLAVAFSQIAQEAVRRAIEGAARGRFASVEQALQFIHHAIVAAARSFIPAVQAAAQAIAKATMAQAKDAVAKVFKPRSSQKRGHGHRRTGAADWPGSMMGMGDAVLDSVVEKANEIQDRHKAIIDQVQPDMTKDQTRAIAEQVGFLKTEWEQWALPAVGVQFPYQLNRANPAHAVLIAVRDDLADTYNMLNSGLAQQALAKQIKKVLSEQAALGVPMLPGSPGSPGIGDDIKKYALIGAAVVVGAIALPHIMKAVGIG
jgi:hypothetical protein